jgi:hypothetical protein
LPSNVRWRKSLHNWLLLEWCVPKHRCRLCRRI